MSDLPLLSKNHRGNHGGLLVDYPHVHGPVAYGGGAILVGADSGLVGSLLFSKVSTNA